MAAFGIFASPHINLIATLPPISLNFAISLFILSF